MGGWLATGGRGGLILKESAHFPSEGMSGAAFRHGPFEMLGPHVFLLVFSGDAISSQLNERLGDDVCSAGGQAALVSEDAEDEVFRLPPVPPPVRPVVEILPLHIMSLPLSPLPPHQATRSHLSP